VAGRDRMLAVTFGAFVLAVALNNVILIRGILGTLERGGP
jgi:hypothetical protein